MSDASTPHRTLILVRHGETEGESSIRYYGRTDVALSELGRSQMRAARREIAIRIDGVGFDRVFSSPLRRALEGARIIAGHGDVRIEILEEFIEVDFGLFEGLTADEIRTRHPGEFARWNSARFDPSYAYPGGESRAGFENRVARGVERMLALWDRDERRDHGPALLVAHRGVIQTVVRQLTGAAPTVELGSIQILEGASAWHAAALDLLPPPDDR